MYEKNEAGELVPKIAGLSDYKNLSKSMEGYDAILKQFSASEMRGNPIDLLHLFNQAVLGRRFKTDPTGKTTIHQTDKGIQQSIERIPEAIKESFEDLMDFVNPKAHPAGPQGNNTFIQSNPTSFRGGSRGVLDPNHGLLYSAAIG